MTHMSHDISHIVICVWEDRCRSELLAATLYQTTDSSAYTAMQKTIPACQIYKYKYTLWAGDTNLLDGWEAQSVIQEK